MSIFVKLSIGYFILNQEYTWFKMMTSWFLNNKLFGIYFPNLLALRSQNIMELRENTKTSHHFIAYEILWEKTAGHLHSRILRNRKKELLPVATAWVELESIMLSEISQLGKDERQIPCDLTYNWNLMNKINQQAKQNWRHRNMEQNDSDQRGGRRRIMVERRGRD